MRKSSWKRFWTSFLVTLLLTGSLFGYYYYVLLTQNLPAGQKLTDVTVPTYTAANNLRFLLIYDPDLSGTDLSAAVLCCNLATKTIASGLLDLRIDCMVSQSHDSLAAQYRLRGVSGLREGAENLLQCEFDAVIRCDTAGLSALIYRIGGVSLTRADCTSLTEEGLADGRIFSACWSEHPDDRQALLQKLIAACFQGEAQLQAAQAAVFAQCETDFNAYQAVQAEDAMGYLISLQHFSDVSLTAQALEWSEQLLYIPDPDQLSILQATFCLHRK